MAFQEKKKRKPRISYSEEKARFSDQIESNWGRKPIEVDSYPRSTFTILSLKLLLILSELCSFEDAKKLLDQIRQTRRRRAPTLQRRGHHKAKCIGPNDIDVAIRGVSADPAELVNPKALSKRCYQIAMNGDHADARLHDGSWKSDGLTSLLSNFFTPHAKSKIQAETWSYTARLPSTFQAEPILLGHQNPKTEIGNMYFSLFQQALRQDPLLYAATVALRRDREWKLQSNPLCMRYRLLSPGDGPKPGVRVFKENEFPKTPLLSMTHRFAGKDNQDVVVCALIWFEPTSKMDKGRLKYLRNSNLKCEIPKYTPDDNIEPRGQFERHHAPNFFPPCSAIGSALLGKRSWDDNPVKYELGLLFGSDRGEAQDYVREVRKEIEATWESLFEVFKKEEMKPPGGEQSGVQQDAADSVFAGAIW